MFNGASYRIEAPCEAGIDAGTDLAFQFGTCDGLADDIARLVLTPQRHARSVTEDVRLLFVPGAAG